MRGGTRKSNYVLAQLYGVGHKHLLDGVGRAWQNVIPTPFYNLA